MANKALYHYVLGLGDSSLILGQRLSEWLGHAPALELDIAASNLSLDLIGAAQLYLDYAAELSADARDADHLAFHRDVLDFRNHLLLEQPNKDWGRTIVRLYLWSVFMDLYLAQLAKSKDATIAAIAAKSAKEVAYHRRFSTEWMFRLGDGTLESKGYVQRGLDDLWRYTGELFVVSAEEQALIDAGIAVDAAALREDWDLAINEVLAETGLNRPDEPRTLVVGRYDGYHSEHLGHLLAEMQFLPRSYPEASW